MTIAAAARSPYPAGAPFTNGADTHVFRFTYEGEPRALHAYLLQRYRHGRNASWARAFYPARVRLNGARVERDTLVRPGDEVAYLHCRWEEPPAPALLPPLHEDPWLLALPKGDSVPVNPSGVYYFTCLAIQARELLAAPELTPLHRLDLETSGPVLFARRARDRNTWHGLFQQKTLRKRYRALVHGAFPEALREIAGTIVPDPRSAIHTRLRLLPAAPDAPGEDAAQANAGAGGEPSRTRVLSAVRLDLGARGVFSELVLEPVTGKTNQLRVHLAHVGHPIVGDKKYHPDEGVFLDWYAHRDFTRLRDRLLLPRQALVCESLAFSHPFTGAPLEIHAPPGAWAGKVAGLLGSGVPTAPGGR
jgi:23S rRNA pseudouridine1911/1915/1917 synthase